MKEVIKVLELNKYEIGIIINALNDLRNKLINQEIDTYDVDEVLLKTFTCPSASSFARVHSPSIHSLYKS